MRIDKVSCEQFAGVRDLNVEFSDGVNVVYGRNEAGKSTLVDLISRTFFQSARIDRRRDKDFSDTYFPSAAKGAAAGDFIDGTVEFSSGGETYRLKKEWGAEPRSSLSAPGGAIRDQERINEVLRGVLQYGEGVYTDLLFSSQRIAAPALRALLDTSVKSDARRDIADAVSTAFAESGGVSMDAIAQAIDAKIADIEGKHWDDALGAPQRKAGRWSRDLGSILKAYYDVEDARGKLAQISALEEAASAASAQYAHADAASREAEARFERFNAYAGSLAARSELLKRAERLGADIERCNAALEAWPKLAAELDAASRLAHERSDAALGAKYAAVKAASDTLDAIEAKCSASPGPEPDELSAAAEAQRRVSALENRLCGMNLRAALSLFGGHSASLRSLRTGEELDISRGDVEINEAVVLSVPGVMELRLAPANVDVAAVSAELEEQRAVVSAIFEKYGVTSIAALTAMSREAEALRAKAEAAQNRLELLLGGETLEALRTKAQALPDGMRALGDIDADITRLCGAMDIDKFIASREARCAAYVSEYGSVDALKARCFDAYREIDSVKASLSATQDVPEEYLTVSEPMRALERLQNAAREQRAGREAALAARSAAESRLEGYRESIDGDPTAELEAAQRVLDEQKALLAHWKHIREVFISQREALSSSPMRDVAERFGHYLDLISAGRDRSELPDADKLELGIYSARRRLDYGKLSEGTKDTVSLAFRLAVLDHLFPEGGGVIVLDDPCTDMDEERTRLSCKLIRDCAERHQVIFLTCREEYADMLGGKLIRFDAAV